MFIAQGNVMCANVHDSCDDLYVIKLYLVKQVALHYILYNNFKIEAGKLLEITIVFH